ncbi:MAG: NAD-dependent deacylase [Odoribacter sp.]|nr:NAD-dependent deacylase [Odoribacter sp.]MDY3032552.1 NAD-dependent deacylase [Odoribacter sp.]
MKLVILTGAGMSAESGIKTFRDSDGLWENYRIEDVCTPEALASNPEFVNKFYNERRKQLYEAQPNPGHKGLAELEQYFDVQIITQNIDDLHERAGSHHVLHLHGELKKVRSSRNPDAIYDLDGWELKPGTRCEDGSLLRPHVVFFGESVPNIQPATEIVKQADIFVIIGTSLVVYPAASLLHYAPDNIPVFVIDPNIPAEARRRGFHLIEKGASAGVEELKKLLLWQEVKNHY